MSREVVAAGRGLEQFPRPLADQFSAAVPGEERKEFVGGDAGKDFPGGPVATQAAAEVPQQLVAGVEAEAVIDVAEVPDVDHGEPVRGGQQARALPSLDVEALDIVAVGQAREVVFKGEPGQLLLAGLRAGQGLAEIAVLLRELALEGLLVAAKPEERLTVGTDHGVQHDEQVAEKENQRKGPVDPEGRGGEVGGKVQVGQALGAPLAEAEPRADGDEQQGAGEGGPV